jgi:hypothetical protein
MKSDLSLVREFYDQTLDTSGVWCSLIAPREVKVILVILIGLSYLPDDTSAYGVAHDAPTKANITIDSGDLSHLLNYGLSALRSPNRQDLRRNDI